MTAEEDLLQQPRSPLEWTVRAAWLIALLATALHLVGVLIASGSAVAILTAGPVSVSIQTAEPLHAVGTNSYGGTPYVADTATITATRVTAEVSDLAPATRIGLAFGPLAWVLTGAAVACSLTFMFGGLRAARFRPGTAARALLVAAAVTAIGTSAGQVLDEIARTGLQGVMWHGPTGVHRLGTGGGFTFQLGWLAIALGGAAVAAAASRQDTASAPPATVRT